MLYVRGSCRIGARGEDDGLYRKRILTTGDDSNCLILGIILSFKPFNCGLIHSEDAVLGRCFDFKVGVLEFASLN